MKELAHPKGELKVKGGKGELRRKRFTPGDRRDHIDEGVLYARHQWLVKFASIRKSFPMFDGVWISGKEKQPALSAYLVLAYSTKLLERS